MSDTKPTENTKDKSEDTYIAQTKAELKKQFLKIGITTGAIALGAGLILGALITKSTDNEDPTTETE